MIKIFYKDGLEALHTGTREQIIEKLYSLDMSKVKSLYIEFKS